MSGSTPRGPIRSKALVLYEGVLTAHRSCGIALAEAFDRPPAAYQSLRRGGITGQGTCGAVVAGQLLLGEFLGDPDPTGKVTPALRAAMTRYLARVEAELERGSSPDLVCNNLTGQHGEFLGPARPEPLCNHRAILNFLLCKIVLCHPVKTFVSHHYLPPKCGQNGR
jgi:hypothetical protein